jgi:hypothetical protein
MSHVIFQTVERLVRQLDREEQLALMEQLAHHLRKAEPAPQPMDLHGVWRGAFPEEFDVDAALAEIRSRWRQAG